MSVCRAHTCRAVRAVSRVTVTLLDQSLLTVMRAVSVAVSPASLDRSVTAVLRDTSAFRRAAVHRASVLMWEITVMQAQVSVSVHPTLWERDVTNVHPTTGVMTSPQAVRCAAVAFWVLSRSSVTSTRAAVRVANRSWVRNVTSVNWVTEISHNASPVSVCRLAHLQTPVMRFLLSAHVQTEVDSALARLTWRV